MIRVSRPAVAPAELAAGAQLTAQYGDAYDSYPAAFALPPRRPGARTFPFDDGVYGATAVKASLKAAQHDKCCFCEAVFDANVAGDVEHYRPKAAIASKPQMLRPGYYWLAYTWTNLLYACPFCNQYKKRNHFPLKDEAKRVRHHSGNIRLEDPLLIDPAGTADPRDHIRFRGEVPVWLTAEGERTIRILGLDRPQLERDRREHLAAIVDAHQAVTLLGDDPREEAIAHVARARERLQKAVQPQARFSSAAIDLIASLDAGAPPPP